MEYVIIIISAVFVNNVVLSQFLGICPFIGVSKKVSTAAGMSGAVIFVITLATLVTYLLYQYLLVPLNLGYLKTIMFILVIATLVQMVEIILKKISPALYQALGVFLPLITTNCAVLGVALLAIGLPEANLIKAVVFAFGISLGFGLAIIIFSSIREQLELANIPKGMQGVPISLLIAGLLSLAFMGFIGIV
ncbi:MAG: RnfABCDGE type electron transport complex subunit A [Saprospiraceae bacterium]|nr:RnfABCDGE type electron transport complex subunit A [Saprospiraceae bacterium]